MEIISIIEDLIKFSVRRDYLKKAIDDAKRDQHYAQIEGDMAYYEKDYELERRYNHSVRLHSERREQSESELVQVEQLIASSLDQYFNIIESYTDLELREAAVTLRVKKADIERKITDLKTRREWAISMGNIEYERGNLAKETEYNHISTDCLNEIERITPEVSYYDDYISDLNNQAEKKNDYGSNRRY